jgi:hypothetical protein
VWQVWSAVEQWHTWQDDIEYARLDGEFRAGESIAFRPRGGPNVKLELVAVVPNASFVDVTRFPLARMYDSHELVQRGDELEIRTSIRVEGPLSFLWRKLVAERVANGMPEQTSRLIERARHG